MKLNLNHKILSTNQQIASAAAVLCQQLFKSEIENKLASPLIATFIKSAVSQTNTFIKLSPSTNNKVDF